MINAKEELLEALQRSGKSIEDIEFAGRGCGNRR